jgi:hypothetical protein
LEPHRLSTRHIIIIIITTTILMMPSNDPSFAVLVLHSTCHDGYMEHANHVHNNEARSDSAMDLFETLTALPLECDILVMPEIPTSSMDATSTHSQPDVLEIQAALNPCSISNLLLLQDLAIQHKTSLLLSLSSCRLTYESQSLFVHPVPSTFAVTMEETDHQLLAELTVAFEFESAMTQWLEYQDRIQNSNQTTLPQASPSLQLQDACSLSDESPFPSSSSKGSSKPTRSSKPIPRSMDNDSLEWDTCFATPPKPPIETPRSVQDPLVFVRLQAMLDKEVEQMDQLLHVLAMAGAVLAVLLVWTAAQLYRANKEFEQRGDAKESLIPEPTKMAAPRTTRDESSIQEPVLPPIQEPASVISDWSGETPSSRCDISPNASEITVPTSPDVLSPLSLDQIFQETEVRTPVISNRKNIPVNETTPQAPITSNRTKKEVPPTSTVTPPQAPITSNRTKNISAHVTPPQTPIASSRSNTSDAPTPGTETPSRNEECAHVASSNSPPQVPAPPPLSIHEIEHPEESDFLLLIPKITPLESFSQSQKQHTHETKIRSSNRNILDRIQAARQATATETVSLHDQLASFAFKKNDKPVQVEAAQVSPFREPIKANVDEDESQVVAEHNVDSSVPKEKVEVAQVTPPRRQIGRPRNHTPPSLQDQLVSFAFKKKKNNATAQTDVAHVTPPKTEICCPTTPTPEAKVDEEEYQAVTNPAPSIEVVPAYPLSPVSEPKENKKQNETQTLSPCSQLALEWAQQKSARRNNRKPKKKHTKIRPTGSPFLRPRPQVSRTQGIDLSTSLSPAAPLDTNSDSQQHETLVHRLPFKPTPTAPLVSNSNAQPRETIVSPKIVKPSVPGHAFPALATQSVLGCDLTEDNVDSPIKETRPRLSPLVPMLPELCSTPGSEDSFVDDYW